MEELERKDVRFRVKPGDVVILKNKISGEEAKIVIDSDKIVLNPEFIYSIRVYLDESVSLDDYYYFKHDGNLAENILVLNIKNGYATIKPLVRYTLVDSKYAGYLV